MKKKLICLFFALLLSFSLCACGENRMDGSRPSNGMEILPESSPMVSPDGIDGIVRDQDGFISDGDTGSGTVSPSPAPSASPVPGSTQNGSGTGAQPTTVPSATPKP